MASQEHIVKQHSFDKLRVPSVNKKPITIKPVTYLHGEPRVICEEVEMIQSENAICDNQTIVIRMAEHSRPTQIDPKTIRAEGECNIGLLSNNTLIRTFNLEDYVSLLSKPAFYIAHRKLDIYIPHEDFEVGAII